MSAGNPDPANLVGIDPATVVINSPTKRLIRVPRPAGIRVNPSAITVRLPVGTNIRGLPTVAILTYVLPSSLIGEVVVKEVQGGGFLR